MEMLDELLNENVRKEILEQKLSKQIARKTNGFFYRFIGPPQVAERKSKLKQIIAMNLRKQQLNSLK
jgi:hypothetical protein